MGIGRRFHLYYQGMIKEMLNHENCQRSAEQFILDFLSPAKHAV